MVQVSVLSSAITFFSIVGLGLSIYAYIVELQVEKNSNYVAMCDISEHMSCTKAFKSEYGKGLGIFAKDSIFYKPNSLLGILYYSLVATLSLSHSYFITRVSYWAVMLSNFSSLYFAYVLYFILKDFCVVCVSIYIVNLLTLIFVNLKLKAIVTDAGKKRQ